MFFETGVHKFVQCVQLHIYLRLIGQEGDVDLRQGLDGFGSPTLHQLVEQGIRAGWRWLKKRIKKFNCKIKLIKFGTFTTLLATHCIVLWCWWVNNDSLHMLNDLSVFLFVWQGYIIFPKHCSISWHLLTGDTLIQLTTEWFLGSQVTTLTI